MPWWKGFGDEEEISLPVKGDKYPLDGSPEVIVEVDAVYEDELLIDATLVIRLPEGSEFIQIQVLSLADDEGYSDSVFQLTYRDANGYVISRTYALYENEDGYMTILDGNWALEGEVNYKIIDKYSNPQSTDGELKV